MDRVTDIEIVTPFHPGDQAMSEVVAEVLYGHLPANKKDSWKLPGKGKSLLVFSDNRQDAAFFAPSFQRRHEEIVIRWAIIQVLKEHDKASLSLETLVGELIKRPEIKRGILDWDGEQPREDLEKLIRAKILAEFCLPGGARNSLEDLGLVCVGYGPALDEIDQQSEIKKLLGSHKSKSLPILAWVLDGIRRNRAIKMPPGVGPDDDFIWAGYAQDDRFFSLAYLENIRFRLIPRTKANGEPYPNRYGEFLGRKLGLANWQQIPLGNLGAVVRPRHRDFDPARTLTSRHGARLPPIAILSGGHGVDFPLWGLWLCLYPRRRCEVPAIRMRGRDAEG